MHIFMLNRAVAFLSLFIGISSVPSFAQSTTPASPGTSPPAQPEAKQSTGSDGQTTPKDGSGGTTGGASGSSSTVDYSKIESKIEADLKKQSATSDFSFQLGIGSLVRNGTVTDYVNNANTLSATNLGWATPQYLVGLSMRSPFHNFGGYGRNCKGPDAVTPAVGSQGAAAGGKGKGTKTDTKGKGATTGGGQNPVAGTNQDGNVPGDGVNNPAAGNPCPVWRQRPWSAFINIKFAPGASQTINGYVLGGSYRLTSYLDILAGFALTPVNVPAPGLRSAANNYVTQQQKLGNDLEFNPEAMLNNAENAFDGFSLLDSTGKLIYTGTPLEVDYRGGVVVGVSIPITFSSFFKSPQQ